MNRITEIRWHGRGGQGAKTACLLLADVAFSAGKYVQGFPEYGPERMGAPITAYNRISDDRCTVHSNIYTPDFVVVVDESLLESVDVTAGLKEDGAIVINSARDPESFRSLLARALPQWKKALLPGGVAALSFNTLTFPTQQVVDIACESGWTLCEGTFLGHLRHEVEQAVVRDVIFITNTPFEGGT